MKLKILLISLAFLLFLLVTIALSNTALLKGKIGGLKPGTPCDDNNKCTVNDAIRPNGKCTGHEKPLPASTSKPKPCKEFVCRATTGEFNELSKTNGTVCDDQNLYTSDDKCFKGICKGTVGICDIDGDGIITDKFKDSNFLTAVRNSLSKGPNDDITLQDTLGLTSLNLQQGTTPQNIVNISGVECFTNLVELNLWGNQISDITPLATLVNLTILNLSYNKISDLTPLKNLTKLVDLDLWVNQISDITPLAGLTKLKRLALGKNNISDITLLAGLTNLTELGLYENKISNISPLTNLTKLKWLWLDKNQIIEIDPLFNLVNLTYLNLKVNKIQNIATLINNPGISSGDKVCLLGNPDIPQSQMDVLINKGVDVICSEAL